MSKIREINRKFFQSEDELENRQQHRQIPQQLRKEEAPQDQSFEQDFNVAFDDEEDLNLDDAVASSAVESAMVDEYEEEAIANERFDLDSLLIQNMHKLEHAPEYIWVTLIVDPRDEERIRNLRQFKFLTGKINGAPIPPFTIALKLRVSKELQVVSNDIRKIGRSAALQKFRGIHGGLGDEKEERSNKRKLQLLAIEQISGALSLSFYEMTDTGKGKKKEEKKFFF